MGKDTSKIFIKENMKNKAQCRSHWRDNIKRKALEWVTASIL